MKTCVVNVYDERQGKDHLASGHLDDDVHQNDLPGPWEALRAKITKQMRKQMLSSD